MKHPTISILACIDDWLIKSGRKQESVDEELIITLASEIAQMYTDRMAYNEYVVLLPVDGYSARLPKNFRYVIQAAFKEEVDACCERERVSEWVGKHMDCKITTTIDCPECGKPWCDCGTPCLEIDVNRIWETANPQIFNSHVNHFYRYGHLQHRSGCGYHPEWQLMRKKTHNFFNTPYHIKDCLNFHVDTQLEYDIQHPMIKLNKKKGAILLAYLALPTDEKGFLKIPDIPQSYQAVFYTMEEMLALQDYIRTGGQREAVKYDRLKMEAVKARTRLRNKMKIFDPEDFKNFLQNTWKRILPAFPGSHYKMGAFDPESRFTTHASINSQPEFE